MKKILSAALPKEAELFLKELRFDSPWTLQKESGMTPQTFAVRKKVAETGGVELEVMDVVITLTINAKRKMLQGKYHFAGREKTRNVEFKWHSKDKMLVGYPDGFTSSEKWEIYSHTQ